MHTPRNSTIFAINILSFVLRLLDFIEFYLFISCLEIINARKGAMRFLNVHSYYKSYFNIVVLTRYSSRFSPSNAFQDSTAKLNILSPPPSIAFI